MLLFFCYLNEGGEAGIRLALLKHALLSTLVEVDEAWIDLDHLFDLSQRRCGNHIHEYHKQEVIPAMQYTMV